MAIDAEKLLLGKHYLARGYGWNGSAREIGVSAEKLRLALDPEYREKRQRYEREIRPLLPNRKRRRVHVNKFVVREIPNRVLVERDHALSQSVSITASMMGDPLPGRSALDKKRAQAIWRK